MNNDAVRVRCMITINVRDVDMGACIRASKGRVADNLD